MTIIAKGYIDDLQKQISEPINVYALIRGGSLEAVLSDKPIVFHLFDVDLTEDGDELDYLDSQWAMVQQRRKDGTLSEPQSFIVNDSTI